MKRGGWPALVFALLALHRLGWLYGQTNGVVGWDYRVYLAALNKVLEGFNPYLPVDIGTGFLNHPILLLFVWPFSKLGSAGTGLWLVMLTFAWLAILGIAQNFFKPPDSSFRFALFFFTPFVEAVFMGQSSLLAALFLAVWTVRSTGKPSADEGIWLALAMLIKPQLAILALGAGIFKRRGALITAAGLVLGASLLCELVFYRGLIRDYIDTLLSPQLFGHVSLQNYSLLSTVGMPVGAALFAGALLALCIPALKADREDGHRTLDSGLAAAALLFSPLAWHHHFVIIAFFLAGWRGPRQRTAWLIAALVEIDLVFQMLYIPFRPAVLGAALLLLVAALFLYRHRAESGRFPATI